MEEEQHQLAVWGEDAGNAAPPAPGPPLAPVQRALEKEVLQRAELMKLQAVGGGGGDRRRERMMKNRASAARSRARRHAYVNKLEKEVSLLREQNDNLRKLCDELQKAAEAPMPAVKKTTSAAPPTTKLQRTTSAAF